jgi:GMP synthase-like glutamine amidotransferase
MRIHYIQHVPFEGLGGIDFWAQSKGHELSAIRMFAEDPFPPITDVDWLVILGGPMNIYEEDRYSWLIREKQFLRTAINRGRFILGICLGSQLIADALGARVYLNAQKEIGWFPVEFTTRGRAVMVGSLPSTGTVFHWHGDTFDLPSGAVHLASSVACQNQAFAYDNRVFAFQFHLEITRHLLEQMIKNESDDITEGEFIRTPTEMLSLDEPFAASNSLMHQVLDQFERMHAGGDD